MHAPTDQKYSWFCFQLVAPEVFDKYMDFLLKAYVDDNPLLTWCPKSGCNKAIKALT